MINSSGNYEYGKNPFNDVILELIQNDVDISKPESKNDLKLTFQYMLEPILENPEDVNYLSFDVAKNDEYYKIIPNNFITALWLSSIMVYDIDSVISNNIAIYNSTIYTFDKKNRRLNIRKIK